MGERLGSYPLEDEEREDLVEMAQRNLFVLTYPSMFTWDEVQEARESCLSLGLERGVDVTGNPAMCYGDEILYVLPVLDTT